ncbi:MAG: hypothetical protein KJO15_02530 [Alphaproteobacteria bacterium]|nr:hypothetical protein [Alphaproteobacteria bacterium]
MTRVIQTHQHNKYSLKSGLWVQLWRCEETNTNQSSQEQWTFPLCRAKAASLRESGRAVLLEVVSAGESALRVEEVMDLGVNGCPSHLKLGHWIGLERGKDNESTEQSSSETKTIQSANRIRKRNFEIIGLNESRLPSLDHLTPRAIRLTAGDGFGIGVQANPDGFARLNALIPARHAAAEVIETASFRNAHGGEIPHLCSKMCSKSSGSNTAVSAKTPNSALLSCGYEVAILGKMAETKSDKYLR